MDIVNKYNYINNPNADLLTVLKLALNDFGENLNCVRVGIVQEFLYDKQLVRVKIASQRLIRINRDGTQTTQDYAEIYAKLCYATPYMNQPPKVGDECILLFNDREMESWWINGSANQRAYNRMHDLTDCIAICGLRSQPKLVNIFTNLVEFFYDTLAKTNVKMLSNQIVTTTDKIVNYIKDEIFSKTKLKQTISEEVKEYSDKITCVSPNITLSGGSSSFEHEDKSEKTDTENIFAYDDTVTITPTATGTITLNFNTISLNATTNISIVTASTTIISPTMELTAVTSTSITSPAISMNALTSTSITSPIINLTGTVGASHVDVADGATGTFTSADNKIITVNNGIVVGIS